MPDPGPVGALIVIAAFVAALAILLIRDRRGRRKSGAMHDMGRDDSISYFRDFSSNTSAPGVQEEDRTGRWGEQDPPSR